MKTTLEVLTDAKALITDPAKWIKLHFAVDKDGDDVSVVGSDEAVCFCSVGALDHVAGDYADAAANAASDILDAVCIAKHKTTIMIFNDLPSTTHREVMDLFSDAIRVAQGQS